MADRTGIELARVGEFDLSTGKQKFTSKMLHNAAEKAKAAGAGYRAPLKLGHTDPRNSEVAAADGEPAFGWLHNLRTVGDGDSTVLLGDVTGMPDWLAQVAPSAYPDRSIEGYASEDAETLDVTGLALLGVTPPGIPTIKSWRDLPAALGVAASAPKLIAASFTAANDAAPQTPAGPPVTTQPTQEDDTMSDTLIQGLRERFGFADDANEETILKAVDEARDPAVTPETIAASLKLDVDKVKTALAAAAGTTTEPQLPAGTVAISASALEELKIAAQAGAQARVVQLKAERDEAISGAYRSGKIAAARKDHWAKQWDADPEGTQKALAELPEVYPVAASGHTGSDGTGDTPAFTEDEATAMAALTGTPKGAWI